MPNLPLIQTSFAGGELAPALYSRVDLGKYHVGARCLLNFFVQASGGTTTRPGTKFVGRVKDTTNPVRLIPFQFSTTQTYVLEFGHLYMRVVMNGGHVLEPALTVTAIAAANPCIVTAPGHGLANGDEVFLSFNQNRYLVANVTAATFHLLTLDGGVVDGSTWVVPTPPGTVARVYTLTTPYAGSDLALLKFAQTFDVMTLCHPAYAPADLGRTQHWIWTLTTIAYAPKVVCPTGITATPKNSTGTQAYSYVVTSVIDSPYEESRASAQADCTNAALNQNTGIVNTIAWNAGGKADRYKIYKVPVGTTGTIPDGALYGYIGSSIGTSFDDANIAADGTQTPPVGADPFAPNPISAITIVHGGSGYTNPTLTVTDATGSGADLVAIVDSNGAIVTAYVQFGGAGYTNPTITVVDNPIAGTIAGPGSGAQVTVTVNTALNYPGCVTYYQQRKIFAGSNPNPETLWMTQPGNFANMDVSSPSRDDDAITLAVATRQANAIKGLVSVNALLALTASGAYKISGGQVGAALTPSGTVVAPQAYNGCNDVPALVIGNDILYVSARGSTVRDLSYNFYADQYTGSDMTVLSPHLFFGHQILEWAYADEPYRLVWAVRDDGMLLSFTYLKEQDVYAWARHTTGGTQPQTNGNPPADAHAFKSVASIPEGTEDAVYVVVSRTTPGINNTQPVQYIERLASRNLLTNGAADVTKAWFVDCGMRYSGTPITTVSGLDHLEGASVTILADGNVMPSQLVSNGSITLQRQASIITVGLPYIADLQTLNLETGPGTVQGKRKKITAVTLALENSRGLQVGPSFVSMVAFKERTTQPYGTPIPLTTGDERVVIPPGWNTGGAVCVRQSNPLPATVLAVIPEVLIGDT